MMKDLPDLTIGIGVFGLLMLALSLNDLRLRWLIVLAVVVVALAITGCATREPPPPEPPPLPAPMLCAAPVGMTAQESAPDRPAGEITQRDVAAYLVELHRWGWRGWRRLSSVRAHAAACASNADHSPEQGTGHP
ncbi:MAG: hypothetical protein ACQEXC_00530 [Pseudomonadota bacterium]